MLALVKRVLNQIAMADNQDEPETGRTEQPDLEGQQQDLFDELLREQVAAEQAIQDNLEGSAGVKSPKKMG